MVWKWELAIWMCCGCRRVYLKALQQVESEGKRNCVENGMRGVSNGQQDELGNCPERHDDLCRQAEDGDYRVFGVLEPEEWVAGVVYDGREVGEDRGESVLHGVETELVTAPGGAGSLSRSRFSQLDGASWRVSEKKEEMPFFRTLSSSLCCQQCL